MTDVTLEVMSNGKFRSGVRPSLAMLCSQFSRYDKLELAKSPNNSALRATGWLSWTSAMLGAVTVIGASLAMLGLWWADPLSAAVIATGALTSVLLLHAEQHWRGSRFKRRLANWFPPAPQ